MAIAEAMKRPPCTHGDGLMALQCDAIAVRGIHVAPNAEKDSRLEVLALLRASDTWVRVEVVTTLRRESDGKAVTGLLL